ncbi:metalloprotease [Coemansia sp. RSA 485]|nr:metalloprotease [Coemansia sp. RSA 485]
MVSLNCPPIPADWETNFVARKTIASYMPYKEFAGKLELSPNDKHQYRLIRLPNNMIVVCVQDKDAKQAAAVLTVNVGCFADPPELLGLAHFLEHMLFRGSAKYPKENDFEDYIASNSGENNAITDSLETYYFFKVDNNALEGSLDRLSCFLTDPLMDADCTDRELNAVDSEFKSKLQSDSRRSFVILKSATNQRHAFSKFGTGNNKTLRESAEKHGLDLREELLKFHQKYYSSDIMKLIVVGNHSLDQLSEWAVSMFSGVESKGNTKPIEHSHPLGQNELGRVLRYESVGKHNQFRFVFAIPEVKSTYKQNPYMYICSLLGRSDEGSLLLYLKRLGLATSILSYYYGLDYDNFNLFTIHVYATPEGIGRYSEIAHALFAYLQMLAETGPQKWYHDELKTICEIDYRFFVQLDAEDWRDIILSNIHNEFLEPEHVIYKLRSINLFDPQLISKQLQYLTPTNYTLLIQTKKHKDVECTSKEEFYGIKYDLRDLPSSLTNDMVIDRDLVAKFHMPAPNAYLPKSLSVDKPENTSAVVVATEPTLLWMNDKIEVWFKRDDQFFVPRGSINLSFNVPEVLQTPRNYVTALLYTWYVEDVLRREFYSARLASLYFKVYLGDAKITITTSGLNDKLSNLVCDIAKRLKNLTIDSLIFDMQKISLDDGYTNIIYDRALDQATYHLGCLNDAPGWHYSMVAKEVNSLTVSDLQTFADHLFEKTYVKMIMAGNFYEQDALDLAKQMEDIIDYIPLPIHMRTTSVVQLFDPGYYIFQSPIADKDCKDNAIICQFQCTLGVDKFQNSVRFLLMKILNEPYYDQLRTKEQLGYIVYVTSRELVQAKGYLCFEIQGEYNPVYLTMRIDKFLQDFRQTLLDYDQAKLDTTIKSLVDSWKEDFKSIYQEANDFWSSISSNTYEFEYLQKKIEATSKITKDDLLVFWDKYINPKTAANYTRVDYQMWSSTTYFPDKQAMQTYSYGTIALHNCLVKDGLTAVSLAEAAAIVSNIQEDGSVDALLERVKEMCTQRSNGEELFEKMSGEKSKVRLALEMCISEKSNTCEFVSTNNEKYQAIGMTHLSNGCWIINDANLFKATQSLSGQIMPTRKLVPKFDL